MCATEIDLATHSAEVREVWEAFNAGQPLRVPMILGIASRFTILSRDHNPLGITYREYFLDPDMMFYHQLYHQWFLRHHLPRDVEMGLPQEWVVNVDLQNSYSQLWHGAELRFIDGDVPDTPPFLTDANKWKFIDGGPPEPFSGWLGRAWEYRERFQELARDYEYYGRPVRPGTVPGLGTDGPFTTACAIRGPTELCLDMRDDPDFYHALMDLIVTATIRRIRAFRQRLGLPMETAAWSFADDSIQLVSDATYREMILPYHQRLIDEFGPEGPNSIHLCGDATHLFRTIRDELNVMSFDTGYPVDFGRLRQELGPEVRINGGPHVEVLRSGTPRQVHEETRRILQSGVMEGGRFVLREGNNLAPGTPPENVAAMYAACKQFGRYQ
ncbi:MAG: uroporphyrinogen decarboxylase family protein [Armatimonadota bacterium]|nr:uroporphyrinogen decarboxylase family protein [Armatimonadota bacterium]